MEETLTLSYKAHEKQEEIHRSPARFRVACCGRQFGKTYSAISEVLACALLKPEQTVWYVSPTYRQSKSIAWRLLLKFLDPKLIKRKNEQELEIDLINGSHIALKGTENPDLLRGTVLNFVVLDEYAYMKPDVWELIIEPSLLVHKAPALFIGTPAGFNHFWVLAKRGDHKGKIEDLEEVGEKRIVAPNPEWETFSFTSYDNPYISPAEIDRKKETMARDFFDQEYLAKFSKFTGLVYSEFDPLLHIIDPFDLPSTWTFGVSADPAYATGISGVGFFAVDFDDNVYLYDEIYHSATTEELCDIIKTKVANRLMTWKYADPRAKDFIAKARGRGLYFEKARSEGASRAESWVGEGINSVKTKLMRRRDTGKPSFYVFRNCSNAIKEFKTYEWDKEKERVPKKGKDHTMDAIRYFVGSYSPPAKREWARRLPMRVQPNKVTGYGLGISVRK